MYLYHKLRTQVGYILSILLYVITPFMPSSFLLKFPLSILSPHNSLRARTINSASLPEQLKMFK